MSSSLDSFEITNRPRTMNRSEYLLYVTVTAEKKYPDPANGLIAMAVFGVLWLLAFKPWKKSK